MYSVKQRLSGGMEVLQLNYRFLLNRTSELFTVSGKLCFFMTACNLRKAAAFDSLWRKNTESLTHCFLLMPSFSRSRQKPQRRGIRASYPPNPCCMWHLLLRGEDHQQRERWVRVIKAGITEWRNAGK